jgi:hypothetical protein
MSESDQVFFIVRTDKKVFVKAHQETFLLGVSRSVGDKASRVCSPNTLLRYQAGFELLF